MNYERELKNEIRNFENPKVDLFLNTNLSMIMIPIFVYSKRSYELREYPVLYKVGEEYTKIENNKRSNFVLVFKTKQLRSQFLKEARKGYMDANSLSKWQGIPSKARKFAKLMNKYFEENGDLKGFNRTELYYHGLRMTIETVNTELVIEQLKQLYPMDNELITISDKSVYIDNSLGFFINFDTKCLVLRDKIQFEAWKEDIESFIPTIIKETGKEKSLIKISSDEELTKLPEDIQIIIFRDEATFTEASDKVRNNQFDTLELNKLIGLPENVAEFNYETLDDDTMETLYVINYYGLRFAVTRDNLEKTKTWLENTYSKPLLFANIIKL